MSLNKTNIEWVFNPDGTRPGFTWNPITGCLNGCPYCYARKLANGRLRSRYLANNDIAPIGTMIVGAAMGEKALKDPFYPRFWINRVRENFGACYTGAEPKGIFVCDMGELFGDWVPEQWIRRILNKIGMSYYREHRFYLLTKQPQNLQKWSPFPDNCWVGVTATDEHMAAVGLGCLRDIEAKVKFMSFEPLLSWCEYHHPSWNTWFKDINWLIIGAQTKPYKLPKIDWMEEIVRAADQAGIPVFLKNNLAPLFGNMRPEASSIAWGLTKECGYYCDISVGHVDHYLRQEMPRHKGGAK